MFKSSRAVEIKGIKVDRLQPIAMAEGSIHSYADSLEGLLLKVIRQELDKGTEHVTVLLGNGMDAEDIGEIKNLLNRNIENFQEDVIELHVGGQPYFDYLISVLSD
jgi:dihydroxyacetone kinase-like predicted kinase